MQPVCSTIVESCVLRSASTTPVSAALFTSCHDLSLQPIINDRSLRSIDFSLIFFLSLLFFFLNSIKLSVVPINEDKAIKVERDLTIEMLDYRSIIRYIIVPINSASNRLPTVFSKLIPVHSSRPKGIFVSKIRILPDPFPSERNLIFTRNVTNAFLTSRPYRVTDYNRLDLGL